ncbi:MAG: ATP-binding protein [Candidatus Dojkabacteria bacterium]
MIVRSIKEELSALAKKIGVISIIGPRQSGKTTLVKQFFTNHRYYNLEDPVTRALIMEDPKGFIYDHNEGIIFDEVQKYPELLSYIQVAIDETFKPARFVITGSENLLLSEKISQSLAGRVAIFQLLPLSIGELVRSKLICESHYKQMVYGFYPRIYDQELSPSHLYPDYVASYVERDVRQVKNIGDLTNFQRFLQLMAGRSWKNSYSF